MLAPVDMTGLGASIQDRSSTNSRVPGSSKGAATCTHSVSPVITFKCLKTYMTHVSQVMTHQTRWRAQSWTSSTSWGIASSSDMQLVAVVPRKQIWTVANGWTPSCASVPGFTFTVCVGSFNGPMHYLDQSLILDPRLHTYRWATKNTELHSEWQSLSESAENMVVKTCTSALRLQNLYYPREITMLEPIRPEVIFFIVCSRQTN